jgi:hypothetical protein
VRTPQYTGTPMPKDEPVADNPPDGAIVDYVVPQLVNGPVMLTILDSTNHKICGFSSADKITKPNPAELKFAPQWLPQPMILSPAPGMHRFVWDLHYPKPPATACNTLLKDGVWAPPGKYTIELNVDSKQYSQSLMIRPDPRVKVSEAALQREFVLAQKVEEASAQVAAASDEATRILKALASRSAHANHPLGEEIESVRSKIYDLSEVQLRPDPRQWKSPPPRRASSLRALSADLKKLERAVDGADADPGADALASYARLSKMMAATLHDWQQMKRNDLARLNAEFSKAGEKPIAP